MPEIIKIEHTYLPDRIRRFFKKDDSVTSQKFNDLTVYLDQLEQGKRFEYRVNFSPGEKLTAQSNDMIEISEGNRTSFSNFFLPVGANISRKGEGALTINGKVREIGHKAFLFMQTPIRMTSIEPILASNNPYPDNHICGFIAKGEDVKYVLFQHAKEEQEYKGSEKIKGAVFTVFKFVGDELTDVWNVGGDGNSQYY